MTSMWLIEKVEYGCDSYSPQFRKPMGVCKTQETAHQYMEKFIRGIKAQELEYMETKIRNNIQNHREPFEAKDFNRDGLSTTMDFDTMMSTLIELNHDMPEESLRRDRALHTLMGYYEGYYWDLTQGGTMFSTNFEICEIEVLEP